MQKSIEFQYESHSKKKGSILFGGMVICLIAFIFDVFVGASGIAVKDILLAIVGSSHIDARTNVIIWTMRLPMAILSVLVGCSLGLVGATMQTILDNPLASPYTLGISAGAGFGASIALLSGLGSLALLGNLLIPLCAFACSFLACLGIYIISKAKRFTSATMVLSGIGMVFFFQALQSFVQYLASPEALQGIVFWTFGSLSKANWINIPIIAIILVVVFIFVIRRAWILTAMKLGDNKATAMGINVERLRMQLFILISLLTAAAVSFVGSIGFIGIVGPHISRILVGEDQRFFLPVSAVCGAAVLSVASVASKLIVPGAVFPIGILTSMIGVPFFFMLIIGKKTR